jgi:hypothetical protein
MNSIPKSGFNVFIGGRNGEKSVKCHEKGG